MNKSILMTTLVAALLLSACDKTPVVVNVPPEPVVTPGPAGPVGEPGMEGEKGATGNPGMTGNEGAPGEPGVAGDTTVIITPPAETPVEPTPPN